MNIIVHCKNIDWDTDGEDVKLPKKCDVKLDLDTDIPLMGNCTLTECIEDYLSSGIADYLSDERGFCINSLDCTWEYDFGDIKKMYMKEMKKRYKAYCKKEALPVVFAEWLKYNFI